jgi:hypothetical protein
MIVGPAGTFTRGGLMNGTDKTLNTLGEGMDADGLYEQSIVTDTRHGEIIIMTPITAGRLRDTEREIRFFSAVNISMGGMPQTVRFEIKAGSLEEAVGKWLVEASACGQRTIDELKSQAFQRQLTMPQGARMPPAKSN